MARKPRSLIAAVLFAAGNEYCRHQAEDARLDLKVSFLVIRPSKFPD